MKNFNSTNFLQTILEAGVPALSPGAAPIYSIAKNVSGSNKFSPEAKALAGIVAGGILLLVATMYFNNAAGYLKK